MRVIREMQVVAAVTIKVDPALHCGALRRTDGYRQRRRAVAGTVTLAGTVIAESPELKVPAS